MSLGVVLISKILGKTVVADWDDHDAFIAEDRGRSQFVIRLLYISMWIIDRLAGGVVYANPKMSQFIKNKNKICISNGVDIKLFKTSEDKEVRPTLGFIGSINEIFNLVPYFEFVPSDFKILIIGDGKKRKELEEWGMSKGKKIEVSGWLEQKDIHRLAKNVGIFFTSHMRSKNQEFGACSLKRFEYMALGKPIIAVDVSDNKEVLDGGRAAYLIEKPEEMEKTILHIMNNQKEAIEKAKRARKLAEEKYNWDALSKKT